MSDYLNLPLISEAIILDVLCDFECISSQETNESLLLKRLDLILATVSNFADAFSEMFGELFDNYCHKDLSEKEFLNFVVPRCLILCQRKTYFNLMLVCGFMSEIMYYFISSFNCFHFAKLTWKYLLQIIKKEFEDLFEDLLETENGCGGLLSYCEEINLIVTSYSVEEITSNDSPVNIKLTKSGLLGEEPLINQFKNFNIVDSEMNIDGDFRLQANSRDDIGKLDNLERKVKSKQMVREGTDIIEFVDAPQKISNPSLFNETESADGTQYDKSKKVDFLYELLTDSSEHLNEILSLIDNCYDDIDPDKFSLTEFEALHSDIQEISAMVVQEKCLDKDFCTCPSSKLSEGKHYECPSSNTSDISHSECPSSNTSDTTHSECPTLISLDDAHSECLLNESEEEFNPLQCCELCKGKEEQYLKNWQKNFLERYSELK